MKNDLKRKRIVRRLKKSAGARLVAIIFLVLSGVASTIGIVFQEEFKPVVRQLLSGTIVLDVANAKVVENGLVRLLGKNRTPEASFTLKDKTKTTMAPGNYVVQVYYPSPAGRNELIYEKPIDVKRWQSTTVNIDYITPNVMTLKLEFPKKRYLRQEQLYFSVKSNDNGYLWLFSPQMTMPNLFFPNSSDADNRIHGGKTYHIPPSGRYQLKTGDKIGEEAIIGIITETDNRSYAFHCLKKVAPEVAIKITITDEEKWGYDRAVLKVE